MVAAPRSIQHDVRVSADRPPTARLFLALWPGSAALAALAGWQARWTWPPGAAVVAPVQLHLTLHFIGPVPATRLPELARGLAVKSSRFEITFGGVESWRGGLAALCTDAAPAGLAALHAELQAALSRLALPVDARRWRPHVTLARRAAGATPPARAAPLHWSVRGYALVQSQGGYHCLARYPLT